MKIDIVKVRRTDEIVKEYPGQHRQPCHIRLDCETGRLDACYDGEVGSGVPERVYHMRKLRFRVDPDLGVRRINRLLDAIAPSAAQVVLGYEKCWNGNNHVGHYSNEAQVAREEIARRIIEAEDDFRASQFRA